MNSVETFQLCIKQVTDFIGQHTLDKTLESRLNEQFPYQGEVCQSIFQQCQQGITDGWMCQHEHGGIRYGRVIKPNAALQNYSVDVVDMNDLAGPEHRHPNGEIDLIMPLDDQALFDGHPAGWLVYGPDTIHSPTVSLGRALVLYLLPEGNIEFTRR